MITSDNPAKQLKELSLYVSGFAEGRDDDRLREAAEWLKKASNNICAQGYFGCEAGERCTSDHK